LVTPWLVEAQRTSLINDIYNLLFKNGQLVSILCSHTIEHVDDPEQFDGELRRVDRKVHYIIPPLWDVGAAFNFLEHKWIFRTLKKDYKWLQHQMILPFVRFFDRQNMRSIIA
jgi:hypothetical protein